MPLRSRRTGGSSAGGTSVTRGAGSDLVFGLVDGDTVPAGALRGVERLVGVREQRVLVLAVVGERRDADGDGAGSASGPSNDSTAWRNRSAARAAASALPRTTTANSSPPMRNTSSPVRACALEHAGDRRRARGRRRRVPSCR